MKTFKLTKWTKRLAATTLVMVTGLTALESSATAQDRLRRTAMSFEDFVAWRRKIERDLAYQQQLLRGRQAELLRWNSQDQQAFQQAFGTTDLRVREQVLQNVARTLEFSEQVTLDNFEESPFTAPGQYAYVYRNEPTRIYTDDLYREAPLNGANSGPGVLTHEMSHFEAVAGTRDHEYGVPDVTQLARDYAAGQAVPAPWTNASSFHHYVEGVFGGSLPEETIAAPNAEAPATSPSAAGPVQETTTLVYDENAPRMTQDEFRSQVEASMQRFRAEADRQEAELRARREQAMQEQQSAVAGESNRSDETPAARPTQQPDVYATRPSYPIQNTGSTRENRVYRGDRTSAPIGSGRRSETNNSPRQNRVYYGDGTSAPIGSGRSNAAMQQFMYYQQQAAAQIAQQSQSRYVPSTPAESYTPDTSVAVQPMVSQPETGSYQGTTTLVYDDNAPRNTAVYNSAVSDSGSYPETTTIEFNENAPRNSPTYTPPANYDSYTPPASYDSGITAREYGESAATASLRTSW